MKGERPRGDRVRYSSDRALFRVYLCSWDFREGDLDEPRRAYIRGIESRVTETYLREWAEQTNALFNYLSVRKFSLELIDIQRRSLSFPGENFNIAEFFGIFREMHSLEAEGFVMCVATDNKGSWLHNPNGLYHGSGLFVVDHATIRKGLPQFPPRGYDLTVMHEIGHGLTGPDHCSDSGCLMYHKTDDTFLALCEEDANRVGWGRPFPLSLHLEHRIQRALP